MLNMKTVAIAAALSLGFAAAAFADETTTTTTTREGAPGVVVGVPGVAGVTVGGGSGCDKKTVTHTNDEGDSVSKTRTNCD